MGISYREHVIDRIYRLQKIIDILDAKEFVTDSPKLVLKFLTAANTLLLNRINRIEAEDEISLRRVENFTQLIHYYLDDVKHISTTNIPLELVPILNDILRNNNVTYNLLYRPDTDFNYYYVNFSDNLREEFEHIGDLPETNLSIIGFPLSERYNILLSCMLYHEIGHQLIEELNIRHEIPDSLIEITDNDITLYYDALKERNEVFKKTIRLETVTLDDYYIDEDSEKRKLIEEINTIFSNWLNEVTADLIGFLYIGAPYLLTLSEYSLVHKSPEYYSDTHPPLFLRLKILFKLYNNKKYSAKIKKYGTITKHIAQYKRIAKNTFKKKTNLYSIRSYIIEKKLIKLTNILIETLEKILVINNTDFVKVRIEDSIASLLSLIPPVEYITSTKSILTHNPFTILNAAWIVKENYKPQLYEIYKEEPHIGRAVIEKLTSKALELIVFRNKMRKNK